MGEKCPSLIAFLSEFLLVFGEMLPFGIPKHYAQCWKHGLYPDIFSYRGFSGIFLRLYIMKLICAYETKFSINIQFTYTLKIPLN